jgi:transposase-like protein
MQGGLVRQIDPLDDPHPCERGDPVGHRDGVRIEQQTCLGAGAYERTPERRGRPNGLKAKKVTPAMAGRARETSMGEIAFDVPQVQDGGVYPGALEKGLRGEPALTLALEEIYVQGVSTRKVGAIIERLCGPAVSSTQVSKAAALLDEVLEAWRKRPSEE